jgi:hypothetical protein
MEAYFGIKDNGVLTNLQTLKTQLILLTNNNIFIIKYKQNGN